MEPLVLDDGHMLYAHPIAVLAIPAFIPVVVIVVTVLWIARRDRIAEAREKTDEKPEEAPSIVAPVAENPTHDAAATPPSEAAPRPRRRPRLVIIDEHGQDRAGPE